MGCGISTPSSAPPQAVANPVVRTRTSQARASADRHRTKKHPVLQKQHLRCENPALTIESKQDSPPNPQPRAKVSPSCESLASDWEYDSSGSPRPRVLMAIAPPSLASDFEYDPSPASRLRVEMTVPPPSPAMECDLHANKTPPRSAQEVPLPLPGLGPKIPSKTTRASMSSPGRSRTTQNDGKHLDKGDGRNLRLVLEDPESLMSSTEAVIGSDCAGRDPDIVPTEPRRHVSFDLTEEKASAKRTTAPSAKAKSADVPTKPSKHAISAKFKDQASGYMFNPRRTSTKTTVNDDNESDSGDSSKAIVGPDWDNGIRISRRVRNSPSEKRIRVSTGSVVAAAIRDAYGTKITQTSQTTHTSPTIRMTPTRHTSTEAGATPTLRRLRQRHTPVGSSTASTKSPPKDSDKRTGWRRPGWNSNARTVTQAPMPGAYPESLQSQSICGSEGNTYHTASEKDESSHTVQGHPVVAPSHTSQAQGIAESSESTWTASESTWTISEGSDYSAISRDRRRT